ncbi:hypothetical protein FV227_14100 [Methylobacterium sp. WL119]|uniref:hypothetical protein n=1 Tax=unclassified Methylobacterium TaxID=2615210 RepID=UPI0011CCBB13|nr:MULTISPECIES: hypothetical protein [unclassified Methylobacterium]TXN40685.1 hypothetical protein FV225_05415 [Methylobacterium sp. WL93]TXN50009.1 hypothetical protein FV227_14100 [Methylobacterium sp. WL119]
MPTILKKRLAALEATREAMPRRYMLDEIEAARLRYEALLEEPCECTPQQAAYYATRTLKESAADYDAVLKGAPAPWL